MEDRGRALSLTVTAASTPPATPPATSETPCGVKCWGKSRNRNMDAYRLITSLGEQWHETTFRWPILLSLGWTES